MSTRELPSGNTIQVFEPGKPWVQGAARAILTCLHESGDHVRLVLAGGSTPAAVYEELSSPVTKGHVDWKKVRITFGDERAVDPEDKNSNYRMAKETLLDPLGIPEHKVIRLRGEDPAERAAEKAHQALLRWSQRVPLFDVVLLGLGDDGHVASLFPAESWPAWGTRLAAATRHPDGTDRITLTPSALCSTRFTVMLVSGERKAEAVEKALTPGEPDTAQPVRMVKPAGGNMVWILDVESASRLPESWHTET